MSAISIPTPPPAKARTARCAREQDRGGGLGVEGGYAVGLWPARRAGILRAVRFRFCLELRARNVRTESLFGSRDVPSHLVALTHFVIHFVSSSFSD